MKIQEIQKEGASATSRPAERLVTCHRGCTFLSIEVEKKCVGEKGIRQKMSFSRQEMVADEPKIWDTSFILFNTLPPCLPVSLLDKCHFQSLMVKVLRHISMCLKTLLHLLDLYLRTTDISQNLQKMPPCNPPPPYQQKNFTWLLSVSDLTTVLYQTRKLNDFVICKLGLFQILK